MSQQETKETEANLEVEAAVAEFQRKRETLWNEKFDRAEEFRKSRKAKAAQRKAKEAKAAANAEKARKEEEEFERRLAKFKTKMDRYIPEKKEESLEIYPLYNANGKNGVIAGDTAEIHNEETDVVPQSLELKSSKKQSSVANKNEVITQKAEDEYIGRLQDEESLESLPPIPKRIRYEDLKLESVQSQSVTSLHTGAKLQVNRVPASRIPPTSGISVLGLHPHASAWTKSPPWAQAIVACGIGAGLTGLGFGFYKLIRKLLTTTVSKDTSLKRSHVREWNVTTVGATGKM